MNTFQQVARVVNRGASPLLRAPLVGSLLGRSLAEISYTGRRSGTTFHLVVSYRRRADGTILVGVAMPEKKTWWRNFYPDAGPISLTLDGVVRSGTAVARRTDRGTSVTITLDPA